MRRTWKRTFRSASIWADCCCTGEAPLCDVGEGLRLHDPDQRAGSVASACVDPPSPWSGKSRRLSSPKVARKVLRSAVSQQLVTVCFKQAERSRSGKKRQFATPLRMAALYLPVSLGQSVKPTWFAQIPFSARRNTRAILCVLDSGLSKEARKEEVQRRQRMPGFLSSSRMSNGGHRFGASSHAWRWRTSSSQPTPRSSEH